MPDAPLRIEMAVPTMDLGGMETMVASLVRSLIARGHDAGITCLEHGGALGDQLAADGVRVTVAPAPGRLPLVFPGATAQWFRTRRPDVVHIHSGVWLKAVTAARAAGVPRVVYTCHGLLDSTPASLRLMMRLAAYRTDVSVAVSDPLAGFLATSVRVPPGRLITIPNGIDTARFAPGRAPEVRARLGIAEQALVIGVVARLAPGKNIALLIEGFRRIAGAFPTAVLVVAGEGPEAGALAQQARGAGLGTRVQFLGAVQDTAPLYRAMDLFVLPSLAEGTSISILEALATGLPVLATAVGGNPTLLADGEAGRLFPSGDAAALDAGLRELLGAPAIRTRLGARARDRAVSAYAHETMVDHYLDIYRAGRSRPGVATPVAGAA